MTAVTIGDPSSMGVNDIFIFQAAMWLSLCKSSSIRAENVMKLRLLFGVIGAASVQRAYAYSLQLSRSSYAFWSSNDNLSACDLNATNHHVAPFGRDMTAFVLVPLRVMLLVSFGCFYLSQYPYISVDVVAHHQNLDSSCYQMIIKSSCRRSVAGDDRPMPS